MISPTVCCRGRRQTCVLGVCVCSQTIIGTILHDVVPSFNIGQHHSFSCFEHRRCSVELADTWQLFWSHDVDRVVFSCVRLWTWSPQLVTVATLLCQSPFLSFAWAGGSDRWVGVSLIIFFSQLVFLAVLCTNPSNHPLLELPNV